MARPFTGTAGATPRTSVSRSSRSMSPSNSVASRGYPSTSASLMKPDVLNALAMCWAITSVKAFQKRSVSVDWPSSTITSRKHACEIGSRFFAATRCRCHIATTAAYMSSIEAVSRCHTSSRHCEVLGALPRPAPPPLVPLAIEVASSAFAAVCDTCTVYRLASSWTTPASSPLLKNICSAWPTSAWLSVSMPERSDASACARTLIAARSMKGRCAATASTRATSVSTKSTPISAKSCAALAASGRTAAFVAVPPSPSSST
mmetsp:Transcript_8780/g.35889  ORF Transcript_8780/g.35889 Transcript_8780/m.35889 type:complete len:261 (-) Transcript_8780:504-1286(-)